MESNLLSQVGGSVDPIRGYRLTPFTGTKAVGFMIFGIFLTTTAEPGLET